MGNTFSNYILLQNDNKNKTKSVKNKDHRTEKTYTQRLIEDDKKIEKHSILN